MLAKCRKCGAMNRDVVRIHIPEEPHIPAHETDWCGWCLEAELERVTQELHTTAAQIAVLREGMEGRPNA